jgi:hypothetical protein
MVSEKQLRRIDKRLGDLFGTSKSFGGVSVIAVGDLNQLLPVMVSPVYSSSSESVYVELFGTQHESEVCSLVLEILVQYSNNNNGRNKFWDNRD